jgi:hypothetical protein
MIIVKFDIGDGKIQFWLKWTEILGVLLENLSIFFFLYLAEFFLDGEEFQIKVA